MLLSWPIAGFILVVLIVATLLAVERRTGAFARAIRELVDRQDPPAQA